MALAIGAVTIGDDLLALFRQADGLRNVEASISSNLVYILALEYGHSQQAPDGMYRRQINAFGYMLDEEMHQALAEFAPDFQKAAEIGIYRAASRILVALVEATPVDTGRAKGSWVMRMNGHPDLRLSKPITPGEQRAISRAKKRKAVRDLAKAMRKAERVQKRQSRGTR